MLLAASADCRSSTWAPSTRIVAADRAARGAEDGISQDLGAAGAEQAADAEHLPAAEIEGDTVEH